MDRVLNALELMQANPHPGGKVEQLGVNIRRLNEHEEQEELPPTKRCKSRHSLMTTSQSFCAVCQEILLSACNFLHKRLNDEISVQVQSIINVANETSATELIAAGRNLVGEIFDEESIQPFADDAIGYFVSHGARSFKPTDSITAKLYELLRNSLKGSMLNKLIQTFLITSAHSMLTERAVKCYTQLKTELRSSMSRKSVNNRMCIALNSIRNSKF